MSAASSLCGRLAARSLVRRYAVVQRRCKATTTGDTPPTDEYREHDREAKYSYTAAEFGTEDEEQGHFLQKTTISRLAPQMIEKRDIGIMSIAPYGFRLLDGTFLMGPIAVFPKIVLSWKVLSPDHITEESLTLFAHLEPRLDILVIGVGDKKDVDAVRKRIAPFMRKHRIPFELHRTEDCVSIFNYLNAEGRYVAAVMYPPKDIRQSHMHMMSTLSEIAGDDIFDFGQASIGEALQESFAHVPPYQRHLMDARGDYSRIADGEPPREETIAKLDYLMGKWRRTGPRKDVIARRLGSQLEDKLDRDVRLPAEQRILDKLAGSASDEQRILDRLTDSASDGDSADVRHLEKGDGQTLGERPQSETPVGELPPKANEKT